MSESTSKPNVVPGDAAEIARSFVFEHRASDGIDPRKVVTCLLAAGHGGSFSADVRQKRLRTWALQVLRRLGRSGWLDPPRLGKWPTTRVLRVCGDPRALTKRAPHDAGCEEPAAPPPPPESWETFVQDLVFGHRRAGIGVTDVIDALLQRGYEAKDREHRPDSARELAERELHALEQEGLLQYEERAKLWQPTELLQDWPAAEGWTVS